MAREILRIFVVRIDPVADLRREIENGRVMNARLGELLEARLAIEEADGHAIRRAEFRGVGGGRPMLDREVFPQPVHGSLADVALYFADLSGLHAAFRKGDRAVDIRLGHGSARVRLEGDGVHDPFLPESVEHRPEIGRARWRECLEETVTSFE